jgi:hypothetical protein
VIAATEPKVEQESPDTTHKRISLPEPGAVDLSELPEEETRQKAPAKKPPPPVRAPEKQKPPELEIPDDLPELNVDPLSRRR